jgi:hypothetical protein
MLGRAPGTLYVGGWVGPTARVKILDPAGTQTLTLRAFVTSGYTDCTNTASWTSMSAASAALFCL